MPLVSTPQKYVQLQQLLCMPVFSINYMAKKLEFGSKKKCYLPSESFCIVFEIDEEFNYFKKIFSLLSAIIRIKILKRNIDRNYNLESFTVLGVYPSVYNPFCVYQLSSQAEKYALENILPKSELSPIGIVKGFFESIFKTSLSVGGFCIILAVEEEG